MSTQTDSFKRFVQVGRVVFANNGKDAGKLAVISEIVDHNRALIDGPNSGVARQVVSYADITLTPYVVKGLPRAAKSSVVAKCFDKAGVQAKWEASAWAKKLAARKRRAELTDFERFQVMKLKKQRRYEVAVKAAKKA